MSASRSFTSFLTGLAVGVCLALIFAPQSGEEFREAITEKGKDSLHRWRKSGQRSIDQLQDLVEKGSARVTKALNTSKQTLDAIAEHID